MADDGSHEDVTDCTMSGTAATDVGLVVSADFVTTGCATAGVVDDGNGDDDGEDTITAVSAVSELVGTILAGGAEGVATI